MNSVVTPDFYKIVFLAFERDGLSEGLCTAVAITIHYTRFPDFTPNYPKLYQTIPTIPNNPQLSQMTKTSTLGADTHGKSILSVLHTKKESFQSCCVLLDECDGLGHLQDFRPAHYSFAYKTNRQRSQPNYHQDTMIKHSGAQKRLFLFCKNQNYLPITAYS